MRWDDGWHGRLDEALIEADALGLRPAPDGDAVDVLLRALALPARRDSSGRPRRGRGVLRLAGLGRLHLRRALRRRPEPRRRLARSPKSACQPARRGRRSLLDRDHVDQPDLRQPAGRRRLARGGRPAGRSRAAVRWRPTKETTDLGWLYNRGFADPDGHRFEAVHLDMAATATPPAWAPPPERLARSGPGRWLSQRPRPEPPGNPGCQAVGIPIPRRRDLIPDLLAPDTVAAGADVFPMQQR